MIKESSNESRCSISEDMPLGPLTRRNDDMEGGPADASANREASVDCSERGGRRW
jgi:hypothetical protein